METVTLVELASIAAVMVGMAAFLGYLSDKRLGATVLAFFAFFASGICLGGFAWRKSLGLLIAVLLVAVLGALLGRRVGNRRGAAFVSLLWLGFCGACAIGYQADGLVGLLLITLPGMALFWIGLWRLSRRLLPLRNRSQEGRAFRSLCTFALGTNYPYCVVESGELETRVGGSPFKQFFAGPGIVITPCDHMAVIHDGLKIKAMGEPGLTFTGLFERVRQIVDLRPQLKAYDVEALTKDGIRVRVRTFVFFRIQRYANNGQPALGKAFPFRRHAVLQAVCNPPADSLQQYQWDEVVSIATPQILRDLIGECTFNDLCAPYEPRRDPRIEIISGREDVKGRPVPGLTARLRQKAKDYGIWVIGTAILNLEPVDKNILKERIENWRTEWQRKMTVERGKGEAAAVRSLALARAQAQAEVIRTISEGIAQIDLSDRTVLPQVIAMRLIGAMEEMASPTADQSLPPGGTETVSPESPGR
ncbi:MAG: hypothetical protein H8D43_02150 [Chloroflexi bacterium]|nr:hypothetical protein [Chloroflexota bacterium]